MSRILIIDDEEKLRSLLARIISLEGYEVLQAADAKQAWKKLGSNDVDVVLCDVKLPDANGVELAKSIKEKYPALELILLTAYGNIPDGVKAIKYGAFDYITKGDDNDRILPLLTAASKKARQNKLAAGNVFVNAANAFDIIIGKSKPILAAVELAKKVAASDAAVLLTGETGTGKEVFAQAIHKGSHRSAKPFVAVNCAAFSRDLLESELFGHRAGAFTGATHNRTGLFEEANQGTVFLDEMGEMPIELQAKLLRVLEAGEMMRLGDSKPTKVNVRIIAATNRDIAKEVESGRFRQDLYYRLSTFRIALPPLRERTADIEALATFFATFFAARAGRPVPSISSAFMELLRLYDWPGNIRELKNAIERSVILSENDMLNVEALPPEIQAAAMSANRQGKILSAFDLASAEKVHIAKVLNYTHGNKTEAARLLNIALTTLYRKLDEYKIG